MLGVSWGGAAAQQFARTCAATLPAADPVRHRDRRGDGAGAPERAAEDGDSAALREPEYSRRVAGDIYGGDFRRDPALAAELFKHVSWQSRLGYYLQIGAAAGWTSIHWLHRLKQPTLVMAGADDPLVPLANARLMHRLIPTAN